MHPTQLPASPSYFDTKRRDLAANAYLSALAYQRAAQRDRTIALAMLIGGSVAALCLGLAYPTPAGYCLACAGSCGILLACIAR